mmetsp:Transcript_9473/g.16252  ORF Transcript_9473/g.16252 Transcript_9473/m.16252 type:complete len:171 (+) Transcript_9473:50-562(+)
MLVRGIFGLVLLRLCTGADFPANASLPKAFLSTAAPELETAETAEIHGTAPRSTAVQEEMERNASLVEITGNRTNATKGTWKQLVRGGSEVAPVQSVIVLMLWLCCCSFCCYSAAHQDEVRTMIWKRDQRAKMAEIAEKEMVTRSDHTVGVTSFDGLLSSGSSTYTPPQL